MAAHEPATRGCPKLMPLPQTGGGPYEYGLATCSKYNTSPPRGIPEKGEEICARPGSNSANCCSAPPPTSTSTAWTRAAPSRRSASRDW